MEAGNEFLWELCFAMSSFLLLFHENLRSTKVEKKYHILVKYYKLSMKQMFMVRALEKHFSKERFSVSALSARWCGIVPFFPKSHKVQNDSCQRWKSSYGWHLLPPGGKHYLRSLGPAERNAVEFLQR